MGPPFTLAWLLNMFTILACGDREWDNVARIAEVLVPIITKHGPVRLIHGDARGADRLAAAVCLYSAEEVTAFPADWEKFKRAAGPIRNQQMLDQGPDLVVAFHNDLNASKGTKDMVKRALKKGVPVIHVTEEEIHALQ